LTRAVTELGLPRKRFRRGLTRVALLYPSTYEVAMSSASLHALYHLLNSHEGLYVERFVTGASGPPKPLRSLETGAPLSSFDVIVFTVHYELDYANLLRALLGSGIPVDRRVRGGRPLIVGGGPPLMANPTPLIGAVDAVIIGELEAVGEVLADALAGNASLDDVPGVYRELGQVVEPARAGSWSTPRIILSRGVRQFFGAVPLEAMRGCPYRCVFCMERWVSGPVRFRPVEELLEEAGELSSRYGVRRVSLIGLTVNAHPGFRELLRGLLGMGLEASLPSLRAELLDEEDVKLIAELGQRHITIAPESSERVRRALGKAMSDDDVVRVAEAAARYGLSVKLYLMVGVPGETGEDVEALVGLVERVYRVNKQLHVSVNPLVIKPNTPMQWMPMERPGEAMAKIRRVLSAPHAQATYYDPVLAAAQGGVALSGPEALKLLVEVAERGASRGAWRAVLPRLAELSGLWGWRRGPFPWDSIRHVDRGVLVAEARRFLEAVGLSPPFELD